MFAVVVAVVGVMVRGAERLGSLDMLVDSGHRSINTKQGDFSLMYMERIL